VTFQLICKEIHSPTSQENLALAQEFLSSIFVEQPSEDNLKSLLVISRELDCLVSKKLIFVQFYNYCRYYWRSLPESFSRSLYDLLLPILEEVGSSGYNLQMIGITKIAIELFALFFVLFSRTLKMEITLMSNILDMIQANDQNMCRLGCLILQEIVVIGLKIVKLCWLC